MGFETIAKAALGQSVQLLERWLPAGRLVGHEYHVGNLQGEPGESLRINTRTGRWADFAADESGGDLISLRAAIDHSNQGAAMRSVADELGLEVPEDGKKKRRGRKKKDEADKETWRPIHPVPEDAARATFEHPLGAPHATWEYRDDLGRLIGYVCRFNTPDRPRPKEIFGYSWAVSDSGKLDWRWLSFAKPRPLYGLDKLAKASADGMVVITEGEKAADAAQQLLPKTVVMTWPGGGKALEYADWTALSGRKIILWPDADAPGIKTMCGWTNDRGQYRRGIADILRSLKCNVRIIEVDGMPSGWDAADYDLNALGPAQPWLKARLQAPPEAPPPPDRPARDPGLPLIRVIAGDLPRVVDEAEQVLVDRNPGIFQRGPRLVRVADTKIMVTRERETAAPRIVEVTAANLAEILTRNCHWEKFDGRRDDFVPCDCPSKVAETLLAREGQWRVPVLTGIIEAPTIRPDGSLLDQPGYDPKTGLYLVETAPPAMVPRNPTREDALTALDLLLELIEGFPFVMTEADYSPSRSVALSAMLTAVVRPCLRTAPLHAFSAPEAGSGKTLLCETVGTIATGRPPAVTTQGRTEEEFEKTLGAELLRGAPHILVDNCSYPLRGDKLCQMLTQLVVNTRILGKSETVATPSVSFFLATGNNLEILDDMTRRALLCKIDPGLERPELREFRENPLSRVARDRGNFVSAVLTILFAYANAEFPAKLKPLGSFEDWSNLVRSALVWLGQADPCETMEEIRASDKKRDSFNRLFAVWYDAVGARVMTSKEVIEMAGRSEDHNGAFEYQDLRDALFDVCAERGLLSASRLGHVLRRNNGRVFGPFRLTAEGKTKRGQEWRIEKR